jgi:hypothetical protein
MVLPVNLANQRLVKMQKQTGIHPLKSEEHVLDFKIKLD